MAAAPRPFAVWLLTLTVPISAAAAQGLGDTAARERAKRAKQAAGADGARKTFSNGDLERGKPAGSDKKETAESPAASQPAPSGEGETAGSGEPEVATPSAPVDPGAAQIADLEGRIKVLQDKLNPFSNSYIFGPFGSNDPTEEPRAREELQRLEAELAKAREEAARAPVAPPGQSEPAP